jgi:signal transduction histidine kinase
MNTRGREWSTIFAAGTCKNANWPQLFKGGRSDFEMNDAKILSSTAPESAGPWVLARRYIVALTFVGAAFLIRYWLSPILGEELPFMLFIAAALLAAWHAGAPAGIAALLLGLFLADYFFLRHSIQQNAAGPMPSLLIIRYVFTALLGVVLIEVQHRARRRMEKVLEDVRREVALRKQSQEALLHAQEQLKDHAAQLEARVSERTAALRSTVISLQDVLYNIAHHLRAPLRAMTGFSEILLEQYAPRLDERGRELTGNIRRAAARMDTLAQDLLEYGRFGHIELRLKDVNLAAAVRDATTKLSQSLKDASAEILIPHSLPTVRADEPMLQRALVELIDNAAKYPQPGKPPVVRVRSESRADGRVRLWIEDNGVGVDRRYHQRIFGVFNRLQVDDSPSTGIGLAIVKQVMQRLGGETGVESEPGHGSRFWLDFPAAR